MPPGPPSRDPAAPSADELLGELDTRTWVLIRYVGQPMGEFIPLPPCGLSLGRAPENSLYLPEPEVSWRHAELRVAADLEAVELRELHTPNGVSVNGHRVDADPGPIRLKDGDMLRVGAHHAFKLKFMDASERLYHQETGLRTLQDPVTGLSNRATVLNQLEVHFGLARRHHRPLSVILVDLDWFKLVNDTHSHRAGDQVLTVFGALLRRRLRSSDALARLGGDEFLAVLPETSAALALIAAEDLRRAISAELLDLWHGKQIQLTCSLGVAELKEGDNNGGALLARADAAHYGAKAGGRNRACPGP